jgi:sugar lactone lactonase YvrE
MLAGDVLHLDPAGTVERRHVGRVAAAVRPRRDGGAVIAVARGFVLEDAEGQLVELAPLWSDERVRMNEGGCDPDGRFYSGSMSEDRQLGAAALYRLDPDGSVRIVLAGVTVSNGIDWSPDGTLAYYVDTPTGRIDVFDYDRAGGLTGRRPFVTIDDAAGHPDGLTVDAEGGVWVALHRGGAVRRYGADATLEGVVELPTPLVTACTFGGADLDQLFVTTSRQALGAAADPFAGSLFLVADVGVRGQPVRAFHG